MDEMAVLERDYPDVVIRYERARKRYREALPGYREYEDAKRALAEAGRQLYVVARKLGIEPIGGSTHAAA